MSLQEEIIKRRTFAIISHPDAGKTTLTEKFLLYGGAINLAGSVKGRKTARHAVSDWMEIEKERGISVTSSVLQFRYDGKCVNILDTPGHQDFSEDTYRTLMAADCAVMVIDAGKGVEAQTIKLFKVCVMRHIPIFTFINKLDREARDPFELLDDIERVLGMATCPVNWPLGSGKSFKGIYQRDKGLIASYKAEGAGQREIATEELDPAAPETREKLGGPALDQLKEDLEMLDAVAEMDEAAVARGALTPVFFGSALTNFGVQIFLEHFLRMAPAPGPHDSSAGPVDPVTEPFSAFVFKIQANMNKAHRDRIAFMRVCSGRFEAGMEVNHVQGGRKIRLSQSTQMMAQERTLVEEAYAGDIIGVFDPGVFAIGDTLCLSEEKYRFGGIPTFAPEHFARLRQMDTMKRKQFLKGVSQIAQEGAIQIFQELKGGMEEIIVGVVGVLQFDVLMYRLQNEYNVEAKLEMLPYEHIRWIKSNTDPETVQGTSDMKRVADLKGNPLLLFANSWSPGMVLERNPGLELSEFGSN